MLKKVAVPLGGDCLLCGGRSAEALACGACASALARTGPACPRCALSMPAPEVCGRCLREPPAFDSALAAFEYRFPLDRVVVRFKFAGDLAAGSWLASRLALAARDAPRPDLVVVPPSDPARLRRRGFNPALEIARALGVERGLRVDPFAIARLRATAPQPGLGGHARRANLRGAFECRRSFDGAHVVVVDDVMTTGATVDALARALKSAGARRVDAWVVARTPEPRGPEGADHRE